MCKMSELTQVEALHRAMVCCAACEGIPTEALEAGAVKDLVFASREALQAEYGHTRDGWDVAEGLSAALASIEPEGS